MKKMIVLIVLVLQSIFSIDVSANQMDNSIEQYSIDSIDWYTTNITQDSATIVYNFTCHNEGEQIDPTLSHFKIDMDHDGTYETSLEATYPLCTKNGPGTSNTATAEAINLEAGTEYKVDFVVRSIQGGYHLDVVFKTHMINQPTVTNISNTSATLEVTYALGGSEYGTPAITDDNYITDTTTNGYFEISSDGGESWTNIGGEFNSDITTGIGEGSIVIPIGYLNPDTTYTVRAIINTSGGSAITSENVSFTTKSIAMDVTNITETTATFSAAYNLQKDDLTQDNATLNVEESYFEYWQKDDVENKTKVYFDDLNTTDSATTILVTGLLSNTTYQVQATVVTNEQKIVSISDIVEFTTLESQPIEIVIETPINNMEVETLEDTGSESYIVILLLAIFGIISSLVFKLK